MAFNATSKQVDWERNDLFHLTLDQTARLLCAEVGHKFVSCHEYGPYEFTTCFSYDDAGAISAKNG